MEILYWFLFFAIMIFISFFTWTQLFFSFIITNMIAGGFINYDDYSVSDNWFFKGISIIVLLLKFLFNIIHYLWIKFTTTTSIGLNIKKFIIYLENNYQQIKAEGKKKLILNMMSNMNNIGGLMGPGLMTNTLMIQGTPRLSYDSDDTDDTVD